MNEIDPLPEQEFSQPWHDWFNSIRNFLTDSTEASEITAIQERLDALENPEEDDGSEELYPVGTVMTLVYRNQSGSTVTLTAGETFTQNGDTLLHVAATVIGNSVSFAPAFYDAEAIGVGIWEMVMPIPVTVSLDDFTLTNLRYMANFRRIS